MNTFLFKTIAVSSIILVSSCWLLAGTTHAEGPSFDCGKVEAGSIEVMICKDEGLSELDRKLSEVYTAASRKATNEHPPVLKAEQRGWIKGRNECWKSNDKRKCIEDNYRLRIAELQAKYRLVSGNAPVTYVCDGDPKNEVIVTFFQIDPPTLYAERGDQVSWMFMQPSASGSKYQGRNENILGERRGSANHLGVWQSGDALQEKGSGIKLDTKTGLPESHLRRT